MARTNKIGIDYFPFDVDFFNDEKIEFTSARFGIKGEIIAIRLLCKIYRNGYYTDWNEDESTLLAKRAGDGITPSLVSDIVNELVKRGFFNKSLLDRFKILTSKGIQTRYFEATKRYKQVDVIRDFLLVDVSEIENVNINEINVNINSNDDNINTQKKRKENKINNNTSLELFPENEDNLDKTVVDSGEFLKYISDFNAIRGKGRYKPIDKAKKQFNERLREGFTPAQMLQALKNALQDEFHIKTKFKFLTPEFFTRADKLDKFLNANDAPLQEQDETKPKLGVGEYLRPDGTRTYGSGNTTIPYDAPPRPSDAWWWNAGLNQWNM